MFAFKTIIRSFGIRVSSVDKVQTNDLIMGRWKPEYDNVVQARKVYWANMDHCGCCDTKMINEQIKINSFRERSEDSEEYILPYVMTM